VPPAVKKRIGELSPNASAADRMKWLKSMARNGQYLPPPAAALQQTMAMTLVEELRREYRIRVSETQPRLLRDQRWRKDRLLGLLRQVLRYGLEPAAKSKTLEKFQELVRETNMRNDTSGLNDLLPFYVSEFGALRAGDPFRDEIRRYLDTAIKNARAPIMRVFLLSLKADALPGDPGAAAAAKETMAAGLKLMDELKSQPLQQPAKSVPSLVSGHSVLLVGNRTPCHLMIFLKGPDKFYARLNPYRRGCIVLRNGSYITAVAVTRARVVPFKGQQEYKSQMLTTSYVIKRLGRDGQPEPLDESKEPASGDYTLLRCPAGTPCRVDPRTGMVLPGKKR
jgi:hypothetical protein